MHFSGGLTGNLSPIFLSGFWGHHQAVGTLTSLHPRNTSPCTGTKTPCQPLGLSAPAPVKLQQCQSAAPHSSDLSGHGLHPSLVSAFPHPYGASPMPPGPWQHGRKGPSCQAFSSIFGEPLPHEAPWKSLSYNFLEPLNNDLLSFPLQISCLFKVFFFFPVYCCTESPDNYVIQKKTGLHWDWIPFCALIYVTAMLPLHDRDKI